MNTPFRRQVPLRLFHLPEPAGPAPSWFTTQGSRVSGNTHDSAAKVRPSGPAAFHPITGLDGTDGTHLSSLLGPQAGEGRPKKYQGRLMGAPYQKKATKPMKSPGSIPASQL